MKSMILLYIFMIIALIYIYLRSGKETISEEWSTSKAKQQLYKMSFYLHKKILFVQRKCRGDKRKNRESIQGRGIKEALQCLQPTENLDQLMLKYYLDKINICILIAATGGILMTLIWVSTYSDKVLTDGFSIIRNGFGEGIIDTTLSASIKEDNRSEKIQIEVSERRYTESELDSLYQEFTKLLDVSVLGENESLNQVFQNLKLPNGLSGYPFQVNWECSDYSLMNAAGELGERTPVAGGENITLSAQISCYEWKREYFMEVSIFPKEKDEQEKWKESLMEGIKNNNVATETENKMILPQQINGKEVKWEELKNDNTKILFLLTAAAILFIYYAKDKELHKEVEQRNNEMLKDYPEIVGKMTLLLAAGMTIRTAWKKIAYDYGKKREAGSQKKYAYEEMLIACYEMESGVSEHKSYDNFAKRCRVPCYLRFGVILVQNLKKGSSNLQQILQKESKEAFEERKNMARRFGEEAGTKLLLPMMLMLSVVIVVIIVPAFLSFSI